MRIFGALILLLNLSAIQADENNNVVESEQPQQQQQQINNNDQLVELPRWTFWGTIMDWMGVERNPDLTSNLRRQNPWLQESMENPTQVLLSYFGLTESPLFTQLATLNNRLNNNNSAPPAPPDNNIHLESFNMNNNNGDFTIDTFPSRSVTRLQHNWNNDESLNSNQSGNIFLGTLWELLRPLLQPRIQEMQLA